MHSGFVFFHYEKHYPEDSFTKEKITKSNFIMTI